MFCGDYKRHFLCGIDVDTIRFGDNLNAMLTPVVKIGTMDTMQLAPYPLPSPSTHTSETFTYSDD